MLREIINYLESIEFDVECGLCNGIRPMRTLLNDTPKVQQLGLLCKDRAVAIFILGHMIDLATRKFDPHYRNPLETAMTAYLHALTQSQPDLIKPASQAASLMKGTFWPTRYITEYLSN